MWKLVLVLLLAVGCASVPPLSGSETPAATEPASQPTAQMTPRIGTTDAPPEVTPPPDGNGVEVFLAWIVGLGPGSPEGPTQVDTYQLIQQATQDSCRQALDPTLDVEETRNLYHGAAAACLAALHDKNARWAEAHAAFDSLPGRPAACVDRATYDLLQSVLDAHNANPEARFSLQGPPTDGNPDRVRLLCPRVSDVTVTRSSDALDITIEGMRLDQALSVSYASVESCPQPPDFESLLMLEHTGDARMLHATVTGDTEALAATWLWVGVIAEPVDWVAASDCVMIQ